MSGSYVRETKAERSQVTKITINHNQIKNIYKHNEIFQRLVETQFRHFSFNYRRFAQVNKQRKYEEESISKQEMNEQ